jgi:hypothetical protein
VNADAASTLGRSLPQLRHTSGIRMHAASERLRRTPFLVAPYFIAGALRLRHATQVYVH